MPYKLKLRQARIRLAHWEYWPFWAVYLPVYFYWAWLALKARSAFFFNTANPLITNGGFLMESKKEIYDFMPPSLYPKTVLIKKNQKAELWKSFRLSGLNFPAVAKPDIGMKGLGVAVVKDEAELQAYASYSNVDFLVQDFVAFENEVGIFYVRMPGESKGRITGIVGKAFLAIEGDGLSSMEELLWKNDRAVLQWQALQQQYGSGLKTVLPKGETFILVPYGNHARGAKFIDLSHQIDERLSAVVDKVAQSIPEFYYGRLDVRFQSWEELRQGTAFSIIELNGAGSEPTHIYDPQHSLFFAWKEITRHLNFLYCISRQNRKGQGLQYLSLKEGLAMLSANSRHVTLLKQQAKQTKLTTCPFPKCKTDTIRR